MADAKMSIKEPRIVVFAYHSYIKAPANLKPFVRVAARRLPKVVERLLDLKDSAHGCFANSNGGIPTVR